MAVNINNLIAAINPGLYCDSESKSKVKKILNEQGAKPKTYLEASKEAKAADGGYIDFIDIDKKNAAKAPGIKNPIEKHVLSYDSFGEGLEPIYFWLLDKMNEDFKKVDKVVDNFVTSPGSAQFAEIYTGMGARATRVQDEVSKILGTANTMIKSILNLVYDLKEFQTRFAIYDKLHSKDKAEREAAMYSLKQVWMDTVDIKRGNSSIKALALSQQGGFVTLIDAFMAIEDEKLIYQDKEIDLNERIKRLLKQRVTEFLTWIKESEKEQRKRFQLEKNYLRSQVNMVQLYARWVKPYLKAAKEFEQKATPTAALVNSFNTTIFEIALIGENKYDPSDDVSRGDLPQMFAKLSKDKSVRTYNAVVVLEFNFRSAPERAGQGYGFRGRVDVSFTSYGLNDEEIKILKECLKQDDLGDAFGLIEGATEESLGQIKDDIEEFLGPDKKEEDKKEKEEDSNPFSAIVDGMKEIFSSEKKDKKEDKKGKDSEWKEPASDSYVEKILRSQAIIDARRKCYKLYDSYKKAHKMPSLPGYS